jgi:hypothetical protein
VLHTVLPMVRFIVVTSRLERVVGQLREMLRRETDYENEARNIERLRSILGARADVVIPEVVSELSSKKVLVLSFERGIRIGDIETLERADIDPEAVARTLVDSYLTMLLEHRVFHADPHPGNFLVRPGPVLVMLDFGAVEEVTEPLAKGLKTVVLGGLSRNPDLVFQGIQQMGFVAENGDVELLRRVGQEYLGVLGNLRITDRTKDMFIVGGFNAYPAEIENMVNEHPAVGQVAIVGVPDARMGEVAYAFVIPRLNASLTGDELIAWCREKMANYKAPRYVEIVDELPRWVVAWVPAVAQISKPPAVST